MSRTILLADDSLTIQKVVELTFAETQYDVVSTSSGDDLVQRLDQVSPDLVICDIIMPGKDGYEVCQEIKSDPATLHIPVILLSGTFEPFDRDRALAAGCSEIITKPFEARKLVDTVEALLGGPSSDSAAGSLADVPVSPKPATTGEFAVDDLKEPEATPEEPPAVTAAPAEPPVGEPLSTGVSSPEEANGTDPRAATSLDFTDTGFAEMEAAAKTVRDGPDELPEDGLEFEFSDEHKAFGAHEPADDSSNTDTQPEIEIAAQRQDTAEPGTIETTDAVPEFGVKAEFDFADDDELFEDSDTPIKTDPFAAQDIDELPEAGPTDELDVSAEHEAQTDLIQPSAPLQEFPEIQQVVDVIPDMEPFESEPEQETPSSDVESEAASKEPFSEAEDASREAETSPETLAIPRPGASFGVAETGLEPEETTLEDPPRELESDALPAPMETGPIPVGFEPPSDESKVSAPTHMAESEPTPDVLPAGDAGSPELTDDDIDRIARRMLELASDRVEQIAWEIIPDMAEIVIRRRVRELEAEVEGHSEDES